MTTKAAGEAAKELRRFQLPESSTSDESLPSEDDFDILNEPYKYSDELPTFDIRSISPIGRSPSPIENASSLNDSLSEMCLSPNSSPCSEEDDLADMVPLREINAQINSPAHQPNRNLETIFEGVFLETPPKKTDSWRVDLAKAVVRNSLSNVGLGSADAYDLKTAKRSLCATPDLV